MTGFCGDATANYHPMAWDETGLGFNESEDKDLVSEDICAGLEVENTYTTHGETAFKTYEQYRRNKMVTVECKECPIRNFCPIYVESKYDIFYAFCPLYKIAGMKTGEIEEIGKLIPKGVNRCQK